MFKRITKLPDDAIRMIAGNDVDTNLVLQGDDGLALVVTFEDPRVGNVAIMLTPTAAQRLAITLDAMLTADDATLDAMAAPHGGQLRMSGAWHLELVLAKDARGDAPREAL